MLTPYLLYLKCDSVFTWEMYVIYFVINCCVKGLTSFTCRSLSNSCFIGSYLFCFLYLQNYFSHYMTVYNKLVILNSTLNLPKYFK